MWNSFLKDYFNFSRKERTGIIIIVALILFLIFLPFFYPLFTSKKQFSTTEFKNEIARLKIENSDSLKDRNYAKIFDSEQYDDYSPTGRNKYEKIKAELFYFDPNNATASDWKRLGIRDKTINTIQNYISKGGKFYKPEDIGKIWGLAPSDVKRLTPYVSIKKPGREFVSFDKTAFNKTAAYSPRNLQPVDINLADTSAYISLPGIGSKLSQRIITFREKLGGFYSVEQVGETYFLPDSTFQKIKPRLITGNTKVRQININAASIEEMKAHPYLRYNIANAIFQFRNQHGNFLAIDDIKKIMLVTDEVFQKVAPYLSIQ
ncbi:MAG: helix-hairpin-helix domain-containing protein [Ginsengibacter sp.]